MKHGVPLGSIHGHLLFIIFLHDLPLSINSISQPILFADDTSVIISSKNYKDFCSVSNLVLSHMIKWFAANNLVLNLDHMNIMKFITKNSTHSILHIGYKEKYIEETVNTKFLSLQIDSHINWKIHIEEVINKLIGACYAVRSIVHISNINTFKSIYYAYFNSVIKYGIIFGVILPTVGRFSLYKRKSSELRCVHIPEPHLEVYLNNQRFCLFHANLSSMNFIISNNKIFQIHLYTTLIQGISIIFTDQMPTYLVIIKVHSMLA